ncbi:MAG: sulfotransferase [Anaerolineae bacterium]|nr:sulfotransferase [Anaerolineae bacterium]
MLFNLLSEHRRLIPTRGFPDGEDTEMWVKIGGAFIAGFGGARLRTPIGHCFCLPMDDADIDPARINFMHSYLAQKYPALKRDGFYLLNKNGHLSNKLKYIHKIFPDVKLIHIIRHPYAMIASWKIILAQFGHLLVEIPKEPTTCMNLYPNQGWRRHSHVISRYNTNIYDPTRPDSVRLLARHWVNINTYIMQQLKERPDINCHLVKYEDMCLDQDRTLTALLDFCELPAKTEWVLRMDQAINYKWRTQLTEAECTIIREELEADIAKLGYELPPSTIKTR